MKLKEMYNLSNIKESQKEYSIIHKQRVHRTNKKDYYRLLNTLEFELSDTSSITIQEGFVWDLSSVPRLLWWLLPPDGDFDVAYLIHDYLYIYKKELGYDRKFVDKEMLTWSLTTSGTKNKYSLRNLDIWIRYWGVRLLGGLVWKGYIKI